MKSERQYQSKGKAEESDFNENTKKRIKEGFINERLRSLSKYYEDMPSLDDIRRNSYE